MVMRDATPPPAGMQDALIVVESARTGRNEAGFPLTPLEKRTAAALADLIDADSDPYDLILAELAMSLATNIAKGNVKGRAVANEATALRETLQTLRGEDTEATEDAHGAVLSIMDRLQQPPAVGGPSARDLA